MYVHEHSELGQGWEREGAWIDLSEEETLTSLLQSNWGPPLGLLLPRIVQAPVLFYQTKTASHFSIFLTTSLADVTE